VVISNVAVAVWFSLGNEQQTQSARDERALDRAAATAAALNAIPARARESVVRSWDSPLWRFELKTGKTVAAPMSQSEQKLAQRLKSMLPVKIAKYPVSVKFIQVDFSSFDSSLGMQRAKTDAIQITVPVVRTTQLEVIAIRPPLPGWPLEIVEATVIAILASSAALAWMARRMTRPLTHLASAAALAAAGGDAPHVPEEGPEDVRKAAVAFNTMMDQVKRTLDAQRQLLSAVGHDLRTPITAMRINIEFIAETEIRDRLERNLAELQELTEAVLSAARGSGGETSRNVDLAALVESVCADLDDLGEPVKWTSNGPAPICCRANEVRRAVRNLVENAVSYGGKADVSLETMNGAYEVVVDDEGPGIDAVDRTRVFEPFVRLESSRNLETGGTGLGLTLVKAIAEGHGGAIVLENRAEGGLRARLRLPRSGATPSSA
jgi:signal transduction histidine kinase